jgi:prepilin-type N-terminal cleavage/methylation domain-containing protein
LPRSGKSNASGGRLNYCKKSARTTDPLVMNGKPEANMKMKTEHNQRGFTLVEMLAALAVFTVLGVMVSQLVSGATLTIAAGRKALDADSQARFVFSRMAQDFGRMVRRSDVDMVFAKQDGNDRMFFYSEVPAVSGRAGGVANPVSLVGYRVADGPDNWQLEWLGKGLAWDGAQSADGEVLFLAYDRAGQLDADSMLEKRWPGVFDTNNRDADYHVISDQVFRMEFCFLLNDGTYSNRPVRDLERDANPDLRVKCALNEATDPAYVDDATRGYLVGSRWYNAATSRAYVCVSNSVGNAVWQSAGARDITAVVVAVAILDQGNRRIVTDLTALSSQLPDFTEYNSSGTAALMKQLWNEAVNQPNFAARAGVAPDTARQVRVYQRCFYLE